MGNPGLQTSRPSLASVRRLNRIRAIRPVRKSLCESSEERDLSGRSRGEGLFGGMANYPTQAQKRGLNGAPKVASLGLHFHLGVLTQTLKPESSAALLRPG